MAVSLLRIVGAYEDREKHFVARLEEQNQDLDAFASRVAHDLRAPLTSIDFTASRLSGRGDREDKASATLHKAVGRMDGIIHDLLALSQISSEARDAHCDPATVAESVREDLAPRMPDERGTLRLAVETANVPCSEGSLRQALWNLAENAVKYCRPEAPPEIAIEGRRAGRAYELRVSDNGMGMSPEVAKHAFQPFYRGEQSRDRPGTGLGLSIVKRVVEASGGTVTMDSHVGRGTTFVLRLPLQHGR